MVFVSQPSSTSPACGPLQSPQSVEHVGPHLLLTQIRALTWLLEQSNPQPPQFDSLVEVFVSQPFKGSLSQFAQPPSQVPSVHVPVVQVSEAFARLHPCPHEPQSLVVVRLRSQPFAGLLSQFPQPPSHAPSVHTPLGQVSAAFVRLQPCPQPPQWVRVFRACSQPFAVLPSQFPQPASHVPSVQVPLGQVSGACARLHAVPHPPQSVSVVRLRSQPFAGLLSQFPQPVSHVPSVHVPLGQVSGACAKAHAAPQAPQFASVCRSVSQPFPVLLSQSSHPLSQLVYAHTPEEHDSTACGSVHADPQVPQFVTVCVSVSHPSSLLPATGPSQSAYPVEHVGSHCPLMHARVAAWAPEHTPPQLPQLSTDTRVSVSQPFPGRLSQLPQVVSHELMAQV